MTPAVVPPIHSSLAGSMKRTKQSVVLCVLTTNSPLFPFYLGYNDKAGSLFLTQMDFRTVAHKFALWWAEDPIQGWGNQGKPQSLESYISWAESKRVSVSSFLFWELWGREREEKKSKKLSFLLARLWWGDWGFEENVTCIELGLWLYIRLWYLELGVKNVFWHAVQRRPMFSSVCKWN